MRKSMRAVGLAVALLGTTAAPATADEVLYGLTAGNGLVSFGSASPGATTPAVAITGLNAGETVVGIDVRPRTGQLYAVTSDSRVLDVDPTTGAATVVATMSVPLSGGDYGVDFNPQVDRLRIVSASGQNLRVNPVTGATTTDTALVGSPNVTAAAYTKNFNGTASTTLYDIDTGSDRLVKQTPPNAGAIEDVGALGVAADAVAGFDIGGAEGVAYASLTVGATTSLYTIDLATAAATSVGALGAAVTDVAVARQEITGYVVSADGAMLSRFLPSSGTPGVPAVTGMTPAPAVPPGPQTVTPLGTFTGFAGAGEKIVGIDFRPLNGELYAISRNAGGEGRLYRVDPATAALTQVGSTPFAIALMDAEYGIDFNPVPDRIRLVNSADQNLRINPNDGSVVDMDPMTAGLQPDGTLAFAPMDVNVGVDPSVVAAAYSNNFAGTTATTLYDIETANQIIAIQNPPNAGTLNTQPLAPGATGVSTGPNAGYDITGQDNAAYGVLDIGAASRLFRLQSGLTSISAQGQQGSQLGTLTDADSLTFATSGTVTLNVPTRDVREDAGTVAVTILRAHGEGVVNVRYATANGTAAAGSDYTGTAGSVTFQQGETTKVVEVAVIDDAATEGAETLTLTLTRSAGGYALGTTVQTITIDASDAVASAPPPPPPPPPPPGPTPPGNYPLPNIVRVAAKSLTANVLPKRDRRAPYRFTTSGRLTPTGAFSPARFCGMGRVSVQVKAGGRTVSTRRVGLRANCTYRSTVTFRARGRLGRSGRLKFTARFLGNDRVRPKTARATFARAG